jgi:F-type H+-transporting ATPase subunit b
MTRWKCLLTVTFLAIALTSGTRCSYAQKATAAQTAESNNAGPAAQDPDANPPDAKDEYRMSPNTVKVAGWLHLKPRTASTLFELLNLAVVVIAIVVFAKKKMPKVLGDRSALLEKQLVEARTATEDANRRLHGVEERLAKLDDEIIGMRQQAERDMIREEERFRELLEAEKVRIIDSTEQEIATASAAARRDLKRFAAELAVNTAEQRLQLSSELDHKIVGRFAQTLAGRGDGDKN